MPLDLKPMMASDSAFPKRSSLPRHRDIFKAIEVFRALERTLLAPVERQVELPGSAAQVRLELQGRLGLAPSEAPLGQVHHLTLTR